MQSVTGNFLFGTAGRVGLGVQPRVSFCSDLQALEVVEIGGHVSARSGGLGTKVVGERLNVVDARILSAAGACPLLEGEVGDTGFVRDHVQRFLAALQASHHEVEHWFFGHSRNLAIYDYRRKSQVASHIRYAEKMRKEDQQNARAVLAENVETLIRRAGSQPALVRVIKVPQKTISRAKNDANAANLDTVNDIAHGAGLHPWQLLVPGLDPDNPPSLAQQNVTGVTHHEPERVQPGALSRLQKRGASIHPRVGPAKPRREGAKKA